MITKLLIIPPESVHKFLNSTAYSSRSFIHIMDIHVLQWLQNTNKESTRISPIIRLKQKKESASAFSTHSGEF